MLQHYYYLQSLQNQTKKYSLEEKVKRELEKIEMTEAYGNITSIYTKLTAEMDLYETYLLSSYEKITKERMDISFIALKMCGKSPNIFEKEIHTSEQKEK